MKALLDEWMMRQKIAMSPSQRYLLPIQAKFLLKNRLSCVPTSFLTENLCSLPLYAAGLSTEVAQGDCPEACFLGFPRLRLMRHDRRAKRNSLLYREAAT